MKKTFFLLLLGFLVYVSIKVHANDSADQFCNQYSNKAYSECRKIYFPCDKFKDKDKKYQKCIDFIETNHCDRYQNKPKKKEKCNSTLKKYGDRVLAKFFKKHGKPKELPKENPPLNPKAAMPPPPAIHPQFFFPPPPPPMLLPPM